MSPWETFCTDMRVDYPTPPVAEFEEVGLVSKLGALCLGPNRYGFLLGVSTAIGAGRRGEGGVDVACGEDR